MYRAVLVLALSLPLRASAEPAPTVTVAGYVEAYYQAHFQNPSNRVVNLRAFDDRGRAFTLSNAALDVTGERGAVSARIVVQHGATPSPPIQTALIAIAAPRAVTIEAGLFTSPIGPEVIPIKDDWNWSRSLPFVGLPAYHAGVQVARPLGGGWTGRLHVYNGWSPDERDGTPSVGVSIAHAGARTTAQLLYLGGVERAPGEPEGRAVRHLFDALIQRALTGDLSVMAHADAGLERNEAGTSAWVAGALYGKLALSRCLYAAVRGDYVRERVPAGATAIFWPVEWVASGTATVAYQPADGMSARLEYRHDHAASDAFLGGAAGDPAVPNRDAQDTVTLGMTAWF